jgi:ankyrin repeat protein
MTYFPFPNAANNETSDTINCDTDENRQALEQLDATTTTSSEQTTLHDACEEQGLSAGMSIPSLHKACSEGSVSLVRTLILKHNAHVSARDDNNDTPLH